jgi:hypothetical protein
MTAPAIATEDFMFDLDLRIVQVEEREDFLPRAATQGVEGCIGSYRPCTRGCPTATCRGCPSMTCGRPCRL